MLKKNIFPNIILIGFMGSGKTTVGKALSEKLNWKFLDTDSYIEEKTQKKISQIFKEDGEKIFRAEEKKVVKKILKLKNYVISTGGGMPANEENLQNLKNSGLVIWLKASAEDIYKRIKNDFSRPLLPKNKNKAQNAINSLLYRRLDFYSQCHFMIDTSVFRVKEIVEIIEQICKQFPLA